MNIAIAQMQTIPGAFEQTCARMLGYAERAKEQGAQLAIFGAHTLAGGCMVDEVDQEGFLADLMEALQDFAGQAPLPCLVPVVGDFFGSLVCEAMLVQDGQARALRMESEFETLKRGILGEDGPDDAKRYITFELDGMRFAVAFSDEELDAIGDAGHAFDAVVCAPTHGFSHDNPATQLAAALTETRYQGDADRTGAWIIAAASLGIAEMQVLPGGSFVLAPWGELAAEAPSFEEALIVCQADPYAEGPLPQPLAPDVPDRLLTLMNALIFGLAGFCQAEGVRDVAITMDGTLCSCVTAVLACDALGPLRVHAIVGGAATPELDAAARDLAARLRIDATMAPDGADADAVELMRAKLVRDSGALALLAFDKTALCLDNRAGILQVPGLALLGDVYRSDVLALARLRNTISPLIGQASMRAWRVPAVEGLDRRYLTAESQLEFVDYVLSGRIEWGRSCTKIVEDDRGGELAERILELLRIRRLSRLAAPRVLIVSSQSVMEMPQSLCLRWHDTVRADAGALGLEELGGILRELSTPQEGTAAGAMQRELKDTLSYLHDLAMSGELFGGLGAAGGSGAPSQREPRQGGTGNPWNFGYPFSEN